MRKNDARGSRSATLPVAISIMSLAKLVAVALSESVMHLQADE
jgi:hypothetical protein